MRKCISPNDSLVRRAAKTNEFCEHLAGWEELVQLDVVRIGQLVTTNHQRCGDLFESSIAGAFTDTVDRALGLSCSGLDTGQGIGDGHAEIVVAVCGQDDIIDAGNFFDEHAEGGGVLVWCGVSDRVGNIDRSCPGLDRNGDNLDEEGDELVLIVVVEVLAMLVAGRHK